MTPTALEAGFRFPVAATAVLMAAVETHPAAILPKQPTEISNPDPKGQCHGTERNELQFAFVEAALPDMSATGGGLQSFGHLHGVGNLNAARETEPRIHQPHTVTILR